MAKNYRRIYYRIKHKYPKVIEDVETPGQESSACLIPELYHRYCRLLTESDISKSVYDKRIVFMAVAIMIKDPKYFEFNERLNGRYVQTFARIFNTTQSNITHLLPNVKNYYAIYQKFRNEVDYFYNKMTE